MLGAWGYTQLTGRGAALVIGTMMIAERAAAARCCKQRGFALSDRGLALGVGRLWRWWPAARPERA